VPFFRIPPEFKKGTANLDQRAAKTLHLPQDIYFNGMTSIKWAKSVFTFYPQNPNKVSVKSVCELDQQALAGT